MPMRPDTNDSCSCERKQCTGMVSIYALMLGSDILETTVDMNEGISGFIAV